ncbi:TPA: dihydrofolate reductase family protein [Pseudomonas aeruginosa]|nr:dihydrofolate reductase family protein [Pseudomonas aeruginosa]HEE6759659.1 dihydrofolate reductase family protein [Pseudomonas aeruginosa]
MKKPYVVCHMMISVDGKIDIRDWRLPGAPGKELDLYDRTAESFGAKAYVFGRATISENDIAKVGKVVGEGGRGFTRENYISSVGGEYFVVLDARGSLVWDSNGVDGKSVVVLLLENVSDGYLAHLRELGISYIFVGRESVDLAFALNELACELGVTKVVLGGGGIINGAFNDAGLIDELSLLVYPVLDGRVGVPSVFDSVSSASVSRRLLLKGVEYLEDEVIWLRYLVDFLE